MSELEECAEENCTNEGYFECDDCSRKVCGDHYITCSSDDSMEGCDAGLCPFHYDEHVSEHVFDAEEKE